MGIETSVAKTILIQTNAVSVDRSRITRIGETGNRRRDDRIEQSRRCDANTRPVGCGGWFLGEVYGDGTTATRVADGDLETIPLRLAIRPERAVVHRVIESIDRNTTCPGPLLSLSKIGIDQWSLSPNEREIRDGARLGRRNAAHVGIRALGAARVVDL